MYILSTVHRLHLFDLPWTNMMRQYLRDLINIHCVMLFSIALLASDIIIICSFFQACDTSFIKEQLL